MSSRAVQCPALEYRNENFCFLGRERGRERERDADRLSVL